jgi:hypothetical protein
MAFCRFCFDNKIEGPHNHYLRESKDPRSKVTCPLLLNISCTNCGMKGHTVKYCKSNIIVKKEEKEYDEDGFLLIKRRNYKKSDEAKKSDKISLENEINLFKILSDTLKNVIDTNIFNQPIFESKRPVGMSWADWNEMED